MEKRKNGCWKKQKIIGKKTKMNMDQKDEEKYEEKKITKGRMTTEMEYSAKGESVK